MANDNAPETPENYSGPEEIVTTRGWYKTNRGNYAWIDWVRVNDPWGPLLPQCSEVLTPEEYEDEAGPDSIDDEDEP